LLIGLIIDRESLLGEDIYEYYPKIEKEFYEGDLP